MIVRPQDDGSVILINQTDHAKLSGYLAAHWGNATFAPLSPREPAIRAAYLHDCGWVDYESAPAFNAEAKTTPNFTQVPLDSVQLAQLLVKMPDVQIEVHFPIQPEHFLHHRHRHPLVARLALAPVH